LSSYGVNMPFDDLEKTVLQYILESKEINISQLSEKIGESKANVYRRIEHLEDEQILKSRHLGRQRIVSINPAAIDDVRGVLGIVPSGRVLVLVAESHAKELVEYFKPHETILLTTSPDLELDMPNVRRVVLPEALGECYHTIHDLIREEKVMKNADVAIGLTGNGTAAIAAGMVARDTATPILIVEGGEIRQIV
jgi:DNA-binding Lrp family transcriptional regulator